MAYTPVTVTATYVSAVGSPPAAVTGTVTFTLASRLQDSTDKEFVGPTTVTETLDATGKLSVALVANDDATTEPTGTTWTVTESLSTGAGGLNDLYTNKYQVVIPHTAAGGTIDLAELAPAVAGTPSTTYVLASVVGQAGGVAKLDSSGNVLNGAGQVVGSSFSPVPFSANVGAAVTVSSNATSAELTCTQNGGVITMRKPLQAGDQCTVIVLSGGYTYSIVQQAGCTATPASGVTPRATGGDDEYLYSSPDGTNWVFIPSGVQLSNVASLVENIYETSPASGTLQLVDMGGGYTIHRVVVANSGSVTIQNPTYRQGGRLVVRFETGTGVTVTLPSTATRYGGAGVSAAGTAPTIPSSAVVECVVSMIDGTNYDWSGFERYL